MASEESGEHAVSYAAANGQGSTDSYFIAASSNSIQDNSSIDSAAPSIRDLLSTSGHPSSAHARKNATSDSVRASRMNSSTAKAEVLANGTTENGHQEEDLWSSILNSIKSSRALPVKNVIVLGKID